MPLAYDDKKGYRHPMSEDQKNWEVLQMKKEQWVKMMLGQIASFLAKEKLINPEEQIRFLSIVQKEE